VQLGERLTRHENISRWYPQIVEQAAGTSLELRQTAAWIMGQDRNYAPFHDALLRLMRDPEPMVRRNAALGLASFGDAAARPELVAMLRPYCITTIIPGVVKYRLKLTEYVNPGTLVAHVGETEIRSPVPGEVRELSAREGATVKPGDPLVYLAADPNHVWESLRGLFVVGQAADLEDVQRFTRPIPGIPEKIVKQASETAHAIQAKPARE
jgi:hypothetical protein